MSLFPSQPQSRVDQDLEGPALQTLQQVLDGRLALAVLEGVAVQQFQLIAERPIHRPDIALQMFVGNQVEQSLQPLGLRFLPDGLGLGALVVEVMAQFMQDQAADHFPGVRLLAQQRHRRDVDLVLAQPGVAEFLAGDHLDAEALTGQLQGQVDAPGKVGGHAAQLACPAQGQRPELPLGLLSHRRSVGLRHQLGQRLLPGPEVDPLGVQVSQQHPLRNLAQPSHEDAGNHRFHQARTGSAEQVREVRFRFRLRLKEDQQGRADIAVRAGPGWSSGFSRSSGGGRPAKAGTPTRTPMPVQPLSRPHTEFPHPLRAHLQEFGQGLLDLGIVLLAGAKELDRPGVQLRMRGANSLKRQATLSTRPQGSQAIVIGVEHPAGASRLTGDFQQLRHQRIGFGLATPAKNLTDSETSLGTDCRVVLHLANKGQGLPFRPVRDGIGQRQQPGRRRSAHDDLGHGEPARLAQGQQLPQRLDTEGVLVVVDALREEDRIKAVRSPFEQLRSRLPDRRATTVRWWSWQPPRINPLLQERADLRAQPAQQRDHPLAHRVQDRMPR